MLSESNIAKFTIEEVNNHLTSGKYLPITIKKLLNDRKNYLEKDHFPVLNNKTVVEKKKTIWSNNVSKKIFDNSNVPEKEKKDIKPKFIKGIKQNQNNNQKEYYSSDEDFTNHDEYYY